MNTNYENNIILFKATTGMGKSTDMVVTLMKHLQRTVYIFVPKIAICKGVPTFLATKSKYRNELNMGDNIGYITGDGVQRPIRHPCIVFATHNTLHILLPEILYDHGPAVVIIDECHDVSSSTTLIHSISAIKTATQGAARFPHIFIFTSATLNFKALCPYFEMDLHHKNTIMVHHERFPIRRTSMHSTLEKIIEDVARYSGQYGINRAILFALGIKPIKKDHMLGYKLIPVNRKALMEDPALLERTGGTDRIIYIATQVIESGATLENIDAVFDNGQTLQMIWIPTTNAKGLVLTPENASAAIQRAGRVGRTKPGQVITVHLDDIPLYQIPDIILPIESTKLEDDLASAIVISPNYYDILCMCWPSGAQSFQLPAAGIFENKMEILVELGLLKLYINTIISINSMLGNARIGFDAFVYMIGFIQSGFNLRISAILAIYINESITSPLPAKSLALVNELILGGNSEETCDLMIIAKLSDDPIMNHENPIDGINTTPQNLNIIKKFFDQMYDIILHADMLYFIVSQICPSLQRYSYSICDVTQAMIRFFNGPVCRNTIEITYRDGKNVTHGIINGCVHVNLADGDICNGYNYIRYTAGSFSFKKNIGTFTPIGYVTV